MIVCFVVELSMVWSSNVELFNHENHRIIAQKSILNTWILQQCFQLASVSHKTENESFFFHIYSLKQNLSHSLSVFLSGNYRYWILVTYSSWLKYFTCRINLKFLIRSKETRFLWYQPDGYNVKDTWAIANIYIGSHCPTACSGHGKCTENGCM